MVKHEQPSQLSLSKSAHATINLDEFSNKLTSAALRGTISFGRIGNVRDVASSSSSISLNPSRATNV